jgi:hypothetical protein
LGNFCRNQGYVCINFDKKAWATFWAIILQTHLVTLASCYVAQIFGLWGLKQQLRLGINHDKKRVGLHLGDLKKQKNK